MCTINSLSDIDQMPAVDKPNDDPSTNDDDTATIYLSRDFKWGLLEDRRPSFTHILPCHKERGGRNTIAITPKEEELHVGKGEAIPRAVLLKHM